MTHRLSVLGNLDSDGSQDTGAVSSHRIIMWVFFGLFSNCEHVTHQRMNSLYIYSFRDL